jgi:hypothetical protein
MYYQRAAPAGRRRQKGEEKNFRFRYVINLGMHRKNVHFVQAIQQQLFLVCLLQRSAGIHGQT